MSHDCHFSLVPFVAKWVQNLCSSSYPTRRLPICLGRGTAKRHRPEPDPLTLNQRDTVADVWAMLTWRPHVSGPSPADLSQRRLIPTGRPRRRPHQCPWAHADLPSWSGGSGLPASQLAKAIKYPCPSAKPQSRPHAIHRALEGQIRPLHATRHLGFRHAWPRLGPEPGPRAAGRGQAPQLLRRHLPLLPRRALGH